VATGIQVDTLTIWEDKTNVVQLAALYAVIALPFILGGGVVGLALSRLAHAVNRLYFFDLLGSATGGALSVFVLAWVGSTVTVALAGAVGVLAGCVFALGAGRRVLAVAAPALALSGLACVALAGGWAAVGVPALDWRVPYAKGKLFTRGYVTDARLPSATAEVEVATSRRQPPLIGGEFGLEDARTIEARMVAQDGTAPTMLYRNAARLEAFPFLDDAQAATAYRALLARGGGDPRVLVIGAGGGVDVMVALAHGAASVTAVEINQAMIDMVTKEFDEYLGGLFRPGAHRYSDRIRLVHGEGRSFARSSGERWDIIQMSGVDSFTALSTGAYTLSESFLYTTEAVKDFYAHLSDGGYINYSRFIMTRPKKPRETLRLANIARTALEELGVEDPASHLLVFQASTWASILIKRGPFTRPEVDELVEFASRQGFAGRGVDPLDGPPPTPTDRTLYVRRARLSLEQGLREGRIPGLNGSSATVDRLMEGYWLRLAGRDAAADAVVAEVVGSVPEAQRAVARRRLGRATEDLVRLSRASAAAFEATRADFATLLRGDAQARAAFEKAYPYDVSPSTDDAPFFFNYYKYGGLLRRSAPDPGQDIYHPDYPVGHLVLLLSLLQITLLAAVLIFLPLRSLARAQVEIGGRWRVLAYFAALGAGFMFAEIVLMQKMVLFLGHPTYAVTIVLSALLAFAGLGSLLSGRLGTPSRRALRGVMAAVVAIVLLQAWAGDALLERLLELGFAARASVAVALLAPLGLVLGMPFPLGVRVLEAWRPQFIPWAWAINGFVSVFASIFCIVLAMAIGFQNVLLIAAAIYAAGFAALAGVPVEGAPAVTVVRSADVPD
jgi:hypothetical protein